MVATARFPSPSAASQELHVRFLALLPRIELHGRIYFRHLRGHKKADAIQEMRALAWKWFVRLVQCGKDPSEFLVTFNRLLARAVNAGRRVAGMAKAKDVMNPATQRRHGFTVEPLPCSSSASYEHLYSIPHGQEMHDVRTSLAEELNGSQQNQPTNGNGHEETPRSSGSSRDNGTSGSQKDEQPRRATQSQVKAIYAIAKSKGLNVSQYLRERFRTGKPDDLTIKEASQVIDDLKNGTNEGRRS